jgi:hypothetical protein
MYFTIHFIWRIITLTQKNKTDYKSYRSSQRTKRQEHIQNTGTVSCMVQYNQNCEFLSMKSSSSSSAFSFLIGTAISH